MHYCKSCGNPINDGVKFCSNCGTQNFSDNETTTDSNTEVFKNTNDVQEIKIPNSQQQVVNLWLVLGAIFLFCIFLPSIIGIDGFNGGFAISFVAFFMVIVSIIIVFVYRSRAKQLRRILQGEGRVAIWHYNNTEWKNFIEIDFAEEKKSKKALFYLVSVICLVVGLGMSLIYQEIFFLIICLCIIPVVAIPAFLVPRYRFNKLLHSPAQAIISEKGVVVGRMFHLWVNLTATLDEVKLNTEESPAILEFSYSMITRTGKQTEVARVPVPEGKMDEAKKIVEHFLK